MKSSRNHRRSTSGRRAYRPESHLRAERLEGRLVLSANLGIEFRKGVILITGSEGADTVVVNQPSKTAITVSLNGAAAQSFKASAVRSVVFNGLGGDDSFTNNTAVPAKVDGGKGADTLRGGRGADELRGGDGNDRIFGNLGNDALYGGSGDDFVEGGDGNDREYGEDGADDLHGGRGRDLLFGGRDNDDLYGDEDSDDLYGEDGDDHLDGRQGRDRIRGGGGLDREDDSDDRFEDGDDDGDGYDNDHDRPVSPGLITPIEFTPEGTAQLTGTSVGERDRKYYSFTATASQTLTVTILPDTNGRYAELEVKNGTTGRELLELEPAEDGISTVMMPVVAGTTYVIKVNSSYDYTAVGYTVDLLLDDSPISPIVGTAIEFDTNGFAQLTGTVAGEDAKKVYSFTATSNGTLTATLLPGGDGRYAEVEAENRVTGIDVLKLNPYERSRRTSGSFAIVAGETYVFEIESPFERSGVGFTLNLQLS